MFSSRSKLIYSLGLLLRLLALDLMGATSTVTVQQGLMPYSMNPKKDQLRPALEYPVLLDLFRNTALLPADSDYVQIQNQLFHSGAEGQAGVSSSPTPWQTPAWLNSATGSTFGQSASGGSSLRSSGDEADVGSAQPLALQVGQSAGGGKSESSAKRGRPSQCRRLDGVRVIDASRRRGGRCGRWCGRRSSHGGPEWRRRRGLLLPWARRAELGRRSR